MCVKDHGVSVINLRGLADGNIHEKIPLAPLEEEETF
jgi:hypothetical protein